MIYLQLIWEFMKTGLFAIGGGLATLPFLYEMQAKTGWFTIEDISNMVAVSESTPGPLGVNMATYVGFVIAPPFGGILATLGLIFPSVVIITVIAGFLNQFKESKMVKDAMKTLKAASTGLITAAGLGVLQTVFLSSHRIIPEQFLSDIHWPGVLLMAGLGILMYCFKKLSPIMLIVIAGLAGFILQL